MKWLAVVLALVISVPHAAAAQAGSQADVWRAFAERVEVGTRIRVRLTNGDRVSATLVQAAPDALLLQPRTRVPVPVQRVPYEEIASIEREAGSGIGVGKAIAVGILSGVGAALGTFILIIAALD